MAKRMFRIHQGDKARKVCEDFAGSRRQYAAPAARAKVHRSISGRMAKSAARAPVNA